METGRISASCLFVTLGYMRKFRYDLSKNHSNQLSDNFDYSHLRGQLQSGLVTKCYFAGLQHKTHKSPDFVYLDTG